VAIVFSLFSIFSGSLKKGLVTTNLQMFFSIALGTRISINTQVNDVENNFLLLFDLGKSLSALHTEINLPRDFVDGNYCLGIRPLCCWRNAEITDSL
jgi:hypothetical protein